MSSPALSTMTAPSVAPAGGIEGSAPEGELLGRQFRAFYAELRRALETAAQCPPDQAHETAKTLSQQLAQVIELHTLESRRMAGRGGADAEVQARFLKAALADELMLNLDWPGRLEWRHVLLEAQLMRSSVAGEKVFEDIDAMLQAREPAQRPVAALYLALLSLGFQGRWRGSPDGQRLAQYRRELFQFMAQRDPSLQQTERVASPQAYAHTLGHLARRRIPRLSRWGLGVILVILLLLGASQLLWMWSTWPLREVLNSVVAAVPASSGPWG